MNSITRNVAILMIISVFVISFHPNNEIESDRFRILSNNQVNQRERILLDNKIANPTTDYYPDIQKEDFTFSPFPASIDLDINLVFMGINRSSINTSFLLDRLPNTSQISRYVPLNYLYETFINYSLHYNLIFMDHSFTVEYSKNLVKFGEYGFTPEMGIYWTGRTNVSTYARLSIDSGQEFIEDYVNLFNTVDNAPPNLLASDCTIFFTNLFLNDSAFLSNANYVPHMYYGEKPDIDTGRVSTIRQDSRYSPGYDWSDKRWILLDLSSGPTSYETISSEYSLFNEYFEGLIDSQGLSQQILTLSRAVTFSRLVPTYLYEPTFKPNVNISIAVYHDFDFDFQLYIDTNMILSQYERLFPFSNVQLQLKSIPLYTNDSLYSLLENLNSISDYVTWANALIDLVRINESALFGDYDHDLTMRYTCGVFASDVIESNRSNPVERALGYTSGAYGSPHADSSVVTISPDKVSTWHEGYTQTIIHEVGHTIGLRHPHDFRFNNDLYYLWSWDVCSSPMSYFSSHYEFPSLDLDCIQRGNYRFLFNQTDHYINLIRSIFSTKGFSDNSLPRNYYNSFFTLFSDINESVNLFRSHNFDLALDRLISCYSDVIQLYDDCFSYDDYIYPILDLKNENNSVLDYGVQFNVTGIITSYELPNITLINFDGEIHTLCELQPITNESYRLETEFSAFLSSGLFGITDTSTPIFICVDDGVNYQIFSLVIEFQNLRINIISPIENMYIDISKVGSLMILGNYQSNSAHSNISIIYGGYWYVEDNQGNSSKWNCVTKTNNNEWLLNASINPFVNGNNVIIVKIENDLIERIDQITVKISGLPILPTKPTSESLTDNPLLTNTIQDDNSRTPLINLNFIFFGLLTLMSFVSFKGYRHFNQKKEIREILSFPNLDTLSKLKNTSGSATRVEFKGIHQSKKLDVLKTDIDLKYKELGIEQSIKNSIKIKRRKKY